MLAQRLDAPSVRIPRDLVSLPFEDVETEFKAVQFVIVPSKAQRMHGLPYCEANTRDGNDPRMLRILYVIRIDSRKTTSFEQRNKAG